MTSLEDRAAVARAVSTTTDRFEICRHCGAELSFRGRFERTQWRDGALGTECPDGGEHQPMPGAYTPEEES